MVRVSSAQYRLRVIKKLRTHKRGCGFIQNGTWNFQGNLGLMGSLPTNKSIGCDKIYLFARMYYCIHCIYEIRFKATTEHITGIFSC